MGGHSAHTVALAHIPVGRYHSPSSRPVGNPTPKGTPGCGSSPAWAFLPIPWALQNRPISPLKRSANLGIPAQETPEHAPHSLLSPPETAVRRVPRLRSKRESLIRSCAEVSLIQGSGRAGTNRTAPGIESGVAFHNSPCATFDPSLFKGLRGGPRLSRFLYYIWYAANLRSAVHGAESCPAQDSRPIESRIARA